MSIQNYAQVAAGRRGKADQVNHSYDVVWRVIVDDPRDGPATLGNAPFWPPKFSPYVGYENFADYSALLRGFDVEPWVDGEWRVWRATGTFSTDYQQQQQNQNPEEDPELFWIEREFQDKKVTKDYSGKDIVNSAGQLLNGLTRTDVVNTWVWEKNFLTPNYSLWDSYQNRVNKTTFNGPFGLSLKPYRGLMHILVPKPSFREGIPFYRTQFRVKVSNDADGWRINPADRGTAVIDPVSKELTRPRDRYDQPFDGEVWLDGNGRQNMDPLNNPLNYIGLTDLYEPKSFSPLGF